jgi:hypothetical protein
MITTGVGAPTGRMVDVTITTLAHTVRDSNGSITSLTLHPTKSAPRMTPPNTISGTSSSTVITPNNPQGLGRGQIAGIATGISIIAIAILAGFTLWFLKSQKKITILHKNISDEHVSEKAGWEWDGYTKLELSTGPETFIKEKVELPGTEVEIAELPGDGNEASELPGATPKELPTHEKAQELDARSE